MADKTAFIYDDALAGHTLSDTHPMKPARLRYTYELLHAYGALDHPSAMLVSPRRSKDQEVLTFHSREYLEGVRSLNGSGSSEDAHSFNFGPGDNPAYAGIYDAASLSTGASLTAVELLLSDEVDRAFSISGGLHHAMPGYAYGFCVFNDPVIAINALLEKGLKVAYVDIDCHHGDGVQLAYYDTDAVLTISVHESGTFLFPGTGHVQETGAGRGRGYSVNLPLYPYTRPDLYLWAFREVVPPLLARFGPDVLVTQLGIDSHFKDPITHLAQSVQGFTEAVGSFAGAAPKWLALGGGGYDLQAVARAWASAFGVMASIELPDEIPAVYNERYGVRSLSDSEELELTEQVARDAKSFAESSVRAVRQLVFPMHGLRTA